MNQLTVGLQFGGQTYSQIIFLKMPRSGSLRLDFQFGAQATAVALNTGASAEASTGGGTRTSINAGNDNGVEVDSEALSAAWPFLPSRRVASCSRLPSAVSATVTTHFRKFLN